MQTRDPHPLRRVVAGRLGPLVCARERLGVRLLDALRVDPTVRHERLERHLRDLTTLRVVAGEHDRVGLVVDQDVHARQRLEGPDVAALLADDPALHLVRRQRQHGDRRLRARRDREALHGGGDDPAGARLGRPPRLRLGAAHLSGSVVLRLGRDPRGELGTRLLRGQPGDRLELGTHGAVRLGQLARDLLVDLVAQARRLALVACHGIGPGARRALQLLDLGAVGDEGLLTIRDPPVTTFGVGEQGTCLVLDRGDVLGRAGPLHACLAAGDEDEDERHEAGSEQADDRRQGT